MYKDNLTFPESVERVAEFAHIAMPQGYGNNGGGKLNPLMRVQKDAAEFYHRVLLTTKAGERGMQYAQKGNWIKKYWITSISVMLPKKIMF